jgi:hypothetical protein
MKKYLFCLSFCFLQCTLMSFAQNNHTSMSDTIKLSEVFVLAERPFVQRKADRMIVSVEHSKLLKSRSLSNILNLIPGVSYDGEGGITIMGNGIRIYENGRMVKLSGAQLKRYLSSLRGNDIKSLEILPQATAEYDAEGGTGILVINRQKKHEYGLSGYGGSEYERKSKDSFSEFTGLTYSWGNFAFYANMMLGQSESLSKIAESDYGRKLTVNSISESTDKSLYYMPKLGFDFYISPKQYLGVEWSGNYAKDYANDCWVHSTITDNSPYQTSIQSYTPYTLKPKTNNVTLNYEWKTDTLGSKLNIIADYVGEREHDLYEYENKYTLGLNVDSIISKSQPSFERIDIYSAQVDFAKYFNHHQFTLGAKYVYAGTDYISKLLLGNTTIDGMLSEDIDQRDDFNYHEHRYAIYGMYRYTSQPWDVQVGLRDEYTEWNTKQRVKAQLHNSRNDNNFFPSFFVRKDMGQGNALSLSYTQSINRPSYQMVNPFVFHLSETSYKEGNPYLKGELLYNAALQLVLKSRYIFSLSALFIDRKINEVYEQIGEKQTRYTLKNDGNSKRLVLYMEIPFTWGIWNCRNNAELSQSLYKNSAKRVNDLGVVLSSFNRFRLSKQLTVMANLRYIRHYKQLYLIQKTDYVGVDIEGDYNCLKDKLNINFGVKDLLNRRGKNQQIFRNGDFEHHSDFNFVSRKFFVSVTFSFSAGSKRASQHDKTHSNEEEKERM